MIKKKIENIERPKYKSELRNWTYLLTLTDKINEIVDIINATQSDTKTK